MFEAARFGDEVSHSNALLGFLLGAVAGLALVVVASAFITFTGGFGACLLAGVLSGGVGILGGMMANIGESIGAGMSSPTGAIRSVARNVYINSRLAAIAVEGDSTCSKHPPFPKIAEGSTNVFINGMPASRKGDKLTCGATISSGSSNVFIGGGTNRYLPVSEEVPQLLRTIVDGLMFVASIGKGLLGLAGKIGAMGLKAATPCILQFAAGVGISEVISRYAIGPAFERVYGAVFGNPVDATCGRKVLPESGETDFSLPGLMPIEWSRFYASDLTVDSVLGQGWILPWEQSLRRNGEFLYLTDNQGRTVPFLDIAPGERYYNAYERIHLIRTEGGHYLLQTLDDIFFYFGEVANDNQPVPIHCIENAFGHYLNFSYDEDRRLTDICATGDIRVHLHYEHPRGRLTHVNRVVDNLAVETLVTYGYDENGQLNHVVNRNGDSVRQFSYAEGVMVRHSNALGLACEYRWETIDGKPRVVEHWTSDGEHFHFDYDFDARITRVRDVLGREAETHYNPYHRVTYCRDFGGEETHIELDENGNITGVTLPDANQLKLVYDEFSRLVEETDPLGRTIRYRHHQHTSLVKQIDYPDGSTWKATYNDKGTLLEEYDALGQRTEYFHGEDGLPHTIVDANHKSKYLWWNSLAQVLKFKDCSGKATEYRYNDFHHLVAVTDALGQTTELERKPAGEVLRIQHPDGTKEAFTYNALGQVLTHVDGKGQTTKLQRTSRGLPALRKDANGQQLRYEYDKAIRLSALINENTSAYRFNYDASDRLIEEIRVDNLTRRFSYTVGGHLTRLQEIGYGERGERPERFTEFERDKIGRLMAKSNRDARQEYQYDIVDRLLKIERTATDVGRKIGVNAETLAFEYDILGRLIKESTPQGPLGYEYDPLHNLTTLTLSDGRQVNHLYYGSGHLHQLNLDGKVISDFERDDLHREIYRTQGKLTSRFGYDAMGRKAWQYASTIDPIKLSSIHNPLLPGDFLLDDTRSPIERQYSYDPAGELVKTLDKLRGETKYQYEPNGQLHSRDTGSFVDGEQFRYDPAANRLNHGTSQFDKVKDNRLKKLNGQEFSYDAWGNLVIKRTGQFLVNVQEFEYDTENRLVHTQNWEEGKLVSEGWYQYDSLGRRVKKKGLTAQSSTLIEKIFQWQGLRLLQEQTPDGQSLYFYEPNSYAPLARIDDLEGQEQKTYYFHTDQIGTPLEMSDAEGRIVWQATFKSWGELQSLDVGEVEQNLRFQGQYFDAESGLHYNTFRYYDPKVGRFTTQDPIGLMGGENLYQYGVNPILWIDPWGWSCRLDYVGRTPGKSSKTGRAVIERMRAEGRIRGEGKKMEFKSSTDNGWYSVQSADMAHKTDAVAYWNQRGGFFGAKSKEVRSWMRDSNNYELEHYSFNRSAGARLQQGYRHPSSFVGPNEVFNY